MLPSSSKGTAYTYFEATLHRYYNWRHLAIALAPGAYYDGQRDCVTKARVNIAPNVRMSHARDASPSFATTIMDSDEDLAR